jgi:hypothetical protein
MYSTYGFTLGFDIINSSLLLPLAKIGYFLTTVFEALSPLIFVSRYFRYAWLAVIIPFHFCSVLTMNIFFWENVIIILIFLTPLPGIFLKKIETYGLSPKILDNFKD